MKTLTNPMRKLILAAITFLSLQGTAFGFASDMAQSAPIKDFHVVNSNILRGARPDLQGLKFLAQNGVKTILNLDSDLKHVAWETQEAKKLGIKVISTPLSGFWRPQDNVVEQALTVLADANQYPVYVHCQFGHDRTGLIIALFQVFFENRSPEEARIEMLNKGFHRSLIFLDHYFVEKSGLALRDE